MVDRRIDIALTTVLMVVEVVAAAAAAFFVLLGAMDLSCTHDCDYGPTAFAVHLMAGIAVVVTVAAGLGIGFARVYGRRSTWVPAVAIAVIVASFCGCLALQTVGA